ncbi:MAG TPA: AMP-binding protein [Candidatus Cybelea sp.]|nr:AMP-binding protein [Candidatus Cybelea sp.]
MTANAKQPDGTGGLLPSRRAGEVLDEPVPPSPAKPGPGGETADAARQLLEIARDLAISLRPHRRRTLRVALDSSIDRDLGLDSLGRVELVLRIERAFKAHLAEEVISEAETLGDVLAALRRAARASPVEAVAPLALSLEPIASAPSEALTLLEVLEWHVARHPDRPHIRLEVSDDSQLIITYAALHERARAAAAGLQTLGVGSGDTVAIMLPTGVDFFAAFFGALYAGAVPVPIYPPFRPAQLEDHLRRQVGILRNAEARVLLTTAEGRRVAALVRDQIETLRSVETVADLVAANARLLSRPCAPGDVALVQYTSGSTGDPKGVVLSHANLLANIRAMGEALEASSQDVFVSWLPLYHDMGLIGAWLGSLYFAALAVILSPIRFLARPERWLWAIHRNRATLSAAPNFAYELCLRRIADADINGLDLSTWRMAVNGAEPVSPATLRGFAERFAPFGFRKEAIAPVYGLAECAVGLAFPPPSRGAFVDRVQRASLSAGGFARPAAPNDATALEFVACGHALPGHEIRIVDPAGRELDERHEGRLQFRGPSTTRGYLRNPEKTKTLFDGDWLESGDLAYVVGGEIFLTGRSKDIIIRAGRNIYPHEVEQAIGELSGVRRGCVVAFGSHDPAAGTERLIVIAETRAIEAGERAALRRQIDELVEALLEMPPDDVVLAPPHSVLKTSSGKIRRAACRDLYERGQIGERADPIWRQVVRLRLSGAKARAIRMGAALRALLYAAYWWLLLGVTASFVWPLVALLPDRDLRWRIVHAAARLFLRSAAVRFEIIGSEALPGGGAVMAANHSSYFDSVVVAALLRTPPVFVAKKELAAQFFAGTFLRRLGALFVERTDPEGGIASADAVLAAARAGATLFFFPEGTFTRAPGLLGFHMGAFHVASRTGLPVVPIAIRGTRSILRGDQWFPRHGAVQVLVQRPVTPKGEDWNSALELRDRVRKILLPLVGEPDRAAERIEPPSAGKNHA